MLWTSGWTPRFTGETIYNGPRDRGATGSSPFVRMRPEDIDAGGMETVFPWRESDGDGSTFESHELLIRDRMGVRNPVMLIRIRPEDMTRVVKRQGQESFNFGDCSPTPRSARIWGARPRSTSSRPTASALPVPPVAVRRAALRPTHLRPGRPRPGAASDQTIDKDGYLVANGRFHRTRWTGLLGADVMSPKLAELAAHQADAIDSRYHPSAAVRRQLNKVFPTTGRSCSVRSRCTASSCCCSPGCT